MRIFRLIQLSLHVRPRFPQNEIDVHFTNNESVIEEIYL
jgi:hypothetical protein